MCEIGHLSAQECAWSKDLPTGSQAVLGGGRNTIKWEKNEIINLCAEAPAGKGTGDGAAP